MSQFSTQFQPYLPGKDFTYQFGSYKQEKFPQNEFLKTSNSVKTHFDLRTRVEQLDSLVNFLVDRLGETTNEISQIKKSNFEWFQGITQFHCHFKEDLTNIRVSQSLMEREFKTFLAQNKSFANEIIELDKDFENFKK